MIARHIPISLLVALLIVATSPYASADADPLAVAKVAAGELTEAKASWWGFDPVDSTKTLQAAINSGVKRLIVENMGQPWIVTPLTLVSNQEIVFEQGTVVQAKKGEFKGTNDSLLRINLKQNVTLTGHGAILRMHRWDYDKEPYKKAEWRHVIDIRSSKNIKILGLTLAESGGDGIYLGKSKTGLTNDGVEIKDVVCDGNYRQGISVITAKDLLIENTIMKNTAGTAPAAGIDFEPNRDDEELVNCVMRDCVAEDNQGCAYAFYLPNLTGKSKPISIRLENCVARGSHSVPFAFTSSNQGPDGPLKGVTECVNCTFTGGNGPGIMIRGKALEDSRIRFVNCRIVDPAPKKPNVSPIELASRAGNMLDIGGVDFVDCTLEDPLDRPALKHQDYGGGLRLLDVTGTLTLKRKGKTTRQTFTQDWLDALPGNKPLKRFPNFDMTRIKLVPATDPVYTGQPPLRPFSIRKQGTFVLYANQGDDVRFSIRHLQVGRYGGDPIRVTVIAPSGKKRSVGEVPFQETAELTFKAAESGIHRIPIKAGANKFQFTACNRPLCVSGEHAPIPFISAVGTYYFFVPQGTTEFGAKVFGQGSGEAVDAAIFDPSGKQVWNYANITTPEQYVANPTPAQTGKAWQIRFTKPKNVTMEDFSLQLQGIPPLLSGAADALLKPANGER